ncbi:hypothetical protein J7E88_14475 [Streptomyces sp. ISL-10]|nr:hypothetical protein [Streptomyces sp. ISL-10]
MALATVFTVLPMVPGVTGEGGLMARPPALALIGGLITSTPLTLLLAPTLYAMVEPCKERRRAERRVRRPRQTRRRRSR